MVEHEPAQDGGYVGTVEFIAAHHLSYGADDVGGYYLLGDKARHTNAHQVIYCRLGGLGGEYENLYVRVFNLEAARNLFATEIWEHDIEQDEVGLSGL